MDASMVTGKIASALTMTSHPPVTVGLVAGAITNVSLKILRVTNPEIAEVLAGSEGDIMILVGALAGYLTGRSA